MARRDRRPEIMRAVEKLFAARRLHELTLDDVAREAQVGKGTIYRCFKDKDDLFFQTAISGFDHLCELLIRNAQDDADFDEQLLGACRRISEFHRTRRALFRMMQSEDAHMSFSRGALRREWMQQRKRLRSVMGEILRKGRDRGRIRADVPVEVLSSYLLGMLRTRGRELTGAPESVKSFALMFDLFLKGAGANDMESKRSRK